MENKIQSNWNVQCTLDFCNLEIKHWYIYLNKVIMTYFKNLKHKAVNAWINWIPHWDRSFNQVNQSSIEACVTKELLDNFFDCTSPEGVWEEREREWRKHLEKNN